MESRLVWVAIAAITLLTYHFPGYTYLQSDTQIYLPIMEREMDPTLFRQDLIAQYPHVGYTLYDDASIGLRRATGLSFRRVLQAQQAATRLAFVCGLFLIARSTGLGAALALFVAAVLSLGATIVGPAILAIEYEPVPRGFAFGLAVLMMGLACAGRYVAAGVAGAVAVLYHAPTVAPVWGAYLLMSLDRRNGMWRAFLPLGVAALILFAGSRMEGNPQPLFARISPELEQLQRMRASYNWISIWGRQWLPHYLVTGVVLAAAAWRCWPSLKREMRWFVIVLSVYAVCSVPLSYALLEELKWSLLPQFQPMRAVMMLTFLAAILATIAACRSRVWWQSAGWMLFPYLIPANAAAWGVIPVHRVAVVIALALAAGAAILLWQRASGARAAALAAVAVAGFFAVPYFSRVQNYPPLHTPDLDALAEWARTQTEKDAVFLFPYAAKRLEPGVFRAEALRAVYVDWKTGGQVNYFPELAHAWWTRWQEVMVNPPATPDFAAYAQRGIQYVVVDRGRRLPEQRPVFENESYTVYGTSR